MKVRDWLDGKFERRASPILGALEQLVAGTDMGSDFDWNQIADPIRAVVVHNRFFGTGRTDTLAVVAAYANIHIDSALDDTDTIDPRDFACTVDIASWQGQL